MKIKEGFMLRDVAGAHVVVPVGKASTVLNGIIQLNESGALLWGLLTEGADKNALEARLTEEYGISRERAAADAGAFLDSLRKAGCLEE